jgi:hypothetical protein
LGCPHRVADGLGNVFVNLAGYLVVDRGVVDRLGDRGRYLAKVMPP